jgi:3-hydroxyisobutyrate dehydrogenase
MRIVSATTWPTVRLSGGSAGGSSRRAGDALRPSSRRAIARTVAMVRPVTCVAFLGTGAMGAPMARNLAAAGHEVRAWNRTAERAEGLGAVVCPTPADATETADMLVTMLADGPATETAVADALRPGMLWVQMATVGVAWTDRLAATADAAHVDYLDAPVIGSTPAADAGELIVFASGPEAAINRAAPVLDVVAKETLRLGELGAASRLKLVFNYWVLALTAVTAETLTLADALGAGGEEFLKLIEGGFADSVYAQAKGKKMLTGDLSPLFKLELGRKDLALVLDAAAQAGIELPVARAALTEMDEAIARGHGDSDTAAVIAAFASSA